MSRTTHDENRVKIQVPSGAPLPSVSPKDIGHVWNSSSGGSSSNVVTESRGVVTVLEGPSSGTTLVESLTKSEQAKVYFSLA